MKPISFYTKELNKKIENSWREMPFSIASQVNKAFRSLDKSNKKQLKTNLLDFTLDKIGKRLVYGSLINS